MCTEFQAIELYRNLCEELESQEDFLMNTSDQRVPRNGYHCEESLDDNTKDGVTEIDDPTPSWIHSYGLKNESVYPQEIVYDQELSDDSPPDLLDLDQCNDNFYDIYDNWETKGGNSPTVTNVDRNDFNNDCHLETIESMIFDHKRRNIEEQCRLLYISPDPRDWSCHHVAQWVASVCRQYLYPLEVQREFETRGVNGQDLCNMSESDLKEFCPEAGSLLFSELEIWKTVRSLNPVDYPYEYKYIPTANILPEVDCKPCLSPTYSDGSNTVSSTSSSLSAGAVKMDDVISEPWGLQSGVIPSQHRQPRREHKQTIQLWRFLRELLHQPEVSCGAIKWVDQEKGIFKIEDSSRVAKLWGKRKNRPLMNYDKLSRSIRQYYKKGIIKKTEHSKRLVYQFCDGYL